MNRDEVQGKLVEVISNHVEIDPSTLDPSKHLKYDLGLDSLDVAEMVYEIEEKFGISISDDSIEKIERISDTVDFICAKVNSDGQELSTQEGYQEG